MRLCLIPPRGLERYVLESDYHLTLGIPSCMGNKDYLNVYGQAKLRGDKITMDNGAAEGSPIVLETMNEYAKIIRANEIVLPDVLGNRDRTVDAIENYLAKYPRIHTLYKCMAVVQGTGLRQLIWMVHYLADRKEIKTLGLPRILTQSLGKEEASVRIDLANTIERLHPGRFEIHFLGANPQWPGELLAVSRYAGHVRSMDTSMPFNYALCGRRVTSTVNVINPPVTRPTEYFTKPHKDDRPVLLTENIRTMMEWARAGAKTPSS